MGLLDRFKKTKQRVEESHEVDDAVVAHLKDFLATRAGVEAWVEAPTSVHRPSLLLVAVDGEWTRRPVPSEDWGIRFCDRQGIPVYQAGVVGYPQRMRDYNARQKKLQQGR